MRFIGEGNFNVVIDRLDELLEAFECRTKKQITEVRLLAHLVVSYEEKEFPMGLPDIDIMKRIRKIRIEKSITGDLWTFMI